MKAGGSYAVVFVKNYNRLLVVFDIDLPKIYASPKKVTYNNTGLTAVEKIFNKNIINGDSEKVLHAELMFG